MLYSSVHVLYPSIHLLYSSIHLLYSSIHLLYSFRVSRAQAAFRGNVQRARYKRLKAAAKGRPLRYYALRIQVS